MKERNGNVGLELSGRVALRGFLWEGVWGCFGFGRELDWLLLFWQDGSTAALCLWGAVAALCSHSGGRPASVDDLVEKLVKRLEFNGELNNTYIFIPQTTAITQVRGRPWPWWRAFRSHPISSAWLGASVLLQWWIGQEGGSCPQGSSG